MKFIEFKKEFNQYIVFSIKDIEKRYSGFNKMNLLSWQKKGYIQKIRNSWYRFTDIEIDETTLFYTANKIYNPSYISLETALYYYGVIPEAVFSTNSITTLKTEKFKNNQHLYTYSNIKKTCFFAYKLMQKKNYTYKIAEIEKALLDYLYIRTSIKTYDDIESLRLNKQILQEKLNLQKLFDYATIFSSKVLFNKIKILNQFINA